MPLQLRLRRHFARLGSSSAVEAGNLRFIPLPLAGNDGQQVAIVLHAVAGRHPFASRNIRAFISTSMLDVLSLAIDTRMRMRNKSFMLAQS